MGNKTLPLSAATLGYLQDQLSPEPNILTQLRAVTATQEGPHLQISPEQGRFMALLIKLMRPKLAIELGTYTGYSLLSMGLALQELAETGVKLHSCERHAPSAEIAQRFVTQAGLDDIVEITVGTATDFLTRFEEADTPVDLAFIDADIRGYPEYYARCLKLLRPGGLIILDNIFMNGEVTETDDKKEKIKALDKLNRDIVQDPTVTSAAIPIGDGVLLVFKN